MLAKNIEKYIRERSLESIPATPNSIVCDNTALVRVAIEFQKSTTSEKGKVEITKLKLN